jgi:hypothetical protein
MRTSMELRRMVLQGHKADLEVLQNDGLLRYLEARVKGVQEASVSLCV